MDRLLLTPLVLALPTLFYTWLVRGIDRFEKEPPLYLFIAFMWGAVPAVIGAVLLQTLLAIPLAPDMEAGSMSAALIDAAVTAPVSEEILKGIAVAIIALSFRQEFDGWVDGVVYGAMAGFGFAYVENVLYLWGAQSWSDWTTLFLIRTVVFGGLHGFWTALVGAGFGLARYRQQRVGQILLILGGLGLAILGHVIHNGALTLAAANDEDGGGYVVLAFLNYFALTLFMAFLWLVAGFIDRRTLRIQLRDEVPETLPVEWYEGICAPRSSKLKALGIRGKDKQRLIQAAAELAQKKLQLQKMGEEQGNTARIKELRDQLKQLARNPKS